MMNAMVITDFTSSLQNLRFNSKPLIKFLTGMAERKLSHAPSIVEAIERHLDTVEPDMKLPILYLIDSIVKNVGQAYPTLFSRKIITTFSNVFRVVDPQTRMAMFKLRQTWMNIFPQKLHDLDVQVNMLDTAWPVTPKLNSNVNFNGTSEMFPGSLDTQEVLIQKQKELIELKQKKLQLEMLKLQNELRNNLDAPQIKTSAIHSDPRVLPITNGLVVAASKPIRDPRFLRREAEPTTNGVSKKRPSVESLRAYGNKKPKVEVDALLGNKDTDLRLMVQPERFPKPLPPLITNEPSPHHQNTKLTQSISLAPPVVNIDELLKKLVATGIIVSDQKPSNITTPTFERPETLKIRQIQTVEGLYSGIQCGSCGLRFPPDQKEKYALHLDWHFRQNRKNKKNAKIGTSRGWFYPRSDWMNYTQAEDEEKRVNYFDKHRQTESVANEIEVPSIPDNGDSQCELCHDKFDQFFHDDREEWHLKNAVRVGGKTYHPICYEDHKKSLLEKNKVSKDNIPGLDIILHGIADVEVQPTNTEEVKEGVKMGTSRGWFNPRSDWMNYTPAEEKRENYLNPNRQTGSVPEEVPTALANRECELCHNKFDQFFDDSKKEWHLKNVVRVGAKCYHRICYKDQQTSLLENNDVDPLYKDNKEVNEDEREISDDDDVMIIESVPEIILVHDDDEYDDVPVKVEQIEEQQLNKINNKTEALSMKIN